MLDLKGQVAIVTGGSSGIGRAVAEALAERGAALALAARRQERNREVARQIEDRFGVDVLPLPVDMAEEGQVRWMVQETVARFGRLDILVNNAGIAEFAPVDRLDSETWARMLAVNLTGPFVAAQAAWPHLRKSGRGAIISISSVLGVEAVAEGAGYCASKYGLMGLTDAMIEEAPAAGIRVAAVCPAMVDTPAITGEVFAGPRQELIQPADVARSVLYLLELSPAARVRRIVIERVGAQ